MFSGICAVVPPELVRRCHVHFLKEKGQITTLPKDAIPKIFFFYTKTSSVFILIFIQKQRIDHNGAKTARLNMCNCFLEIQVGEKNMFLFFVKLENFYILEKFKNFSKM